MATDIATLAVRLIGQGGDDVARMLQGAESNVARFARRANEVGRSLTLRVTAPIVGLGVVAFKAASDLNESINKINVVFGGNAERMKDWSKTSAESFGLSRNEALAAAGTLGNLFKGVGIGTGLIDDFSKNMVQAAADLGSFNNANPKQVLDDIQSGLVGQSEPLRKYGILLDEATVGQKAMAMTGKENIKQLTQGEKVAARYELIMEQLGDAQGDFARTSGDAANKTRILRAQFADAAATIGQNLLPIGTKLLTWVSSLLARFTALAPRTQRIVLAIAGLAAALGPALILVGQMAAGVSALGGAFSLLLGPLGLVILALGALFLAWKFDLFGLQTRTREHFNDVTKVFQRLTEEGVDPVSAAIRAFGSALEDLTGIEMSDFFFRLAFFTQLGIAIVRQGIADLGLAIDLAAAIFGQFQRDMEFVFDLIRPVVIEGARAVGQFARDVSLAFDLAGDVIGHWARNVRLAFDLAVGVFREGADAVRQFVRDVQGIGLALGAINTSMFIDAGMAMVQGLIDGWVSRIGLFGFILNNLGLWAIGQVSDTSLALLQKGADFVIGLMTGWAQQAALFAFTLNNLGLWVFGQIGDITATLLQKGIDLIAGLMTGWDDKSQELAGWAQGLGSWVAGQVGDLSGVLFGAGQAIIGGLISGVNSRIGELETALAAIKSLIPDWKGPLSDDLKLLQPAGQAIMQGLIGGIESQIPMLTRRLAGITATIPVTAAVGVRRSAVPSGTSALRARGSSRGGDTYILIEGSIIGADVKRWLADQLASGAARQVQPALLRARIEGVRP